MGDLYRCSRCKKCNMSRSEFPTNRKGKRMKICVKCRGRRTASPMVFKSKAKHEIPAQDKLDTRWTAKFPEWQEFNYSEADDPPSQHTCKPENFVVSRLTVGALENNEVLFYCLHCLAVWRTGMSRQSDISRARIIGLAEAWYSEG